MLVSKVFGLLALVLLSKYALSFENKTQLEWAKTAHNSIFYTGLIFQFADEGLSKWNADKAINPRMKGMTKLAGRLAGMFGAVGAIIQVVLSFIPGEESPELKLMKEEFGKMSQKMDTIARSLDDTKDLIKIASQKAAYIQSEHNIHHGFDRMQECMKKVEGTQCTSLEECKRKKLAIAEGFVSDMKIRKDVEAIYLGVTSDTAFGSSLLDLLKEQSKCNIPKLNLLTNKVTALISKGMIVAIFHDMLKQVDYNVLDDSTRADKMFTIIENKRQAIQDSCFNNFDYWMTLDVQNSHSDFSADIQGTNTNLLYKLNKKYPWIDWHVFTIAGDKEPVAGPNNSPRQNLISSSKDPKVHCFVIPTNDAKVELSDTKLQQWKQLLQDNKFTDGASSGIGTIEGKIKKDAALAGQVQSYAILPGNQWVLGYIQGEVKQHTLGQTVVNVWHRNVFVNRPHETESYLVVVSFRQTDYPPECSESCNGNGKCFVYPYSTTKACRCDPGFSGDKCNSSETNIQLQSVINSILKNTMKLPSFTSIQHTLEDVQMSLLTSSDDIQNSIIELGNKIDEKFKSLGEFMLSTFGWFAVLLKYNDVVDNLNYFHSISKSKIYHFPEMKNFSIASVTRNATDDRFSVLEEKDIVNFLLSPTGIQKWLYQFNFVIVGRRESEFNSHQSLLFMLMDQYKSRVCYEDYKDKLTKTYRQLMLLQLEGYMLWSKAYSASNRDSSVIANRYQRVLEAQQNYLKAEACSVAIPHSKNLHNCTDGYFIHKSLDVPVLCDNGYFPKYVRKIVKKTTPKGKWDQLPHITCFFFWLIKEYKCFMFSYKYGLMQ